MLRQKPGHGKVTEKILLFSSVLEIAVPRVWREDTYYFAGLLLHPSTIENLKLTTSQDFFTLLGEGFYPSPSGVMDTDLEQLAEELQGHCTILISLTEDRKVSLSKNIILSQFRSLRSHINVFDSAACSRQVLIVGLQARDAGL